MSDDEFQIKPGRIRDRGANLRKPLTLVAQLRALSNRAGRGGGFGHTGSKRGTGRLARGRIASLCAGRFVGQRRVVVKARIVRHSGTRFAAAPLAQHLTYLKRDGVTKDGKDAELFSDGVDPADGDVFAERCAGDRHHFRFIVSPEDAVEMSDVHAFTRELMADISKDLDTKLDWVAVDHWNTDNPHTHVLLRGKADNGRDLVIDRAYIGEGIRARAEARVWLELGPRSEQEIDRSLQREINADRFTSLDRRLRSMANELGGVVDLRVEPDRASYASNQHLIARATKLERMELADNIGPGVWRLKPGLEPTLRDLAIKGYIIKSMHRAMTARGLAADTGCFALHGELSEEPVIGRLIKRGLHDELTGSAYAIVDGADGRVHHLKFADLDMTSDAEPGAIVELRQWADRKDRQRQTLSVQSDLDLGSQITARGATWLDRQLVSSEPLALGSGFGNEIDAAKTKRMDFLEREGLIQRHGNRLIIARNLLGTLRDRELAQVGSALAREHKLTFHPVDSSDQVSGVYRKRIQLSSGRFAMIDDGLGFALVPWTKQLDRQLGQYVSGTIRAGGGIEWTLGRSRGIEI